MPCVPGAGKGCLDRRHSWVCWPERGSGGGDGQGRAAVESGPGAVESELTARAGAAYRRHWRRLGDSHPEQITTVVRMSRLDEAQQRLNAALTRLERAVEAKVKAAEKNQASAVDDAQLQALKAENEQLRQASAEAGERLDTAIRRLEGVLDD